MAVTRETVLATFHAVIDAKPNSPRECVEAAMRVPGGADVLNEPLFTLLALVRPVDLFELADKLEGK